MKDEHVFAAIMACMVAGCGVIGGVIVTAMAIYDLSPMLSGLWLMVLGGAVIWGVVRFAADGGTDNGK